MITGVTPTLTGGAITLHTGTVQNLTINASAGTATTAMTALGFTPTFTLSRAAGTNVGTGVVIGNDLQTFTNESISGGAVTTYNAAGTPVNLQLRWAKTDSASLGSRTSGHLEPVLPDLHHRDRQHGGLDQYRHELHLQRQRRAVVAERHGDQHSQRDR